LVIIQLPALIVQLELVGAQRLRQDGHHQPGAEKMAHGLIRHLQRLLHAQLGLAEAQRLLLADLHPHHLGGFAVRNDSQKQNGKGCQNKAE
jgi:hypothetical protein